MSFFKLSFKYFFFMLLIILACSIVLAKSNYLFASELADSVTITPAKPSTNDSIYFSLFNAAHCSCTHYYNQNVAVSESTITLFAQYDEKDCNLRECLSTGSTAVFSSGPIQAGIYKIFKTEDIYCPPGQPCPLIATPERNEWVGDVTITASPLAKQSEKEISKSRTSPAVLSYSSVNKMLTLRITKAQFVMVTAYIINGEKTKEFTSKKYLPAGTHPFRMDLERFSSGVVIIHVKGENFSEVQMINLAK
jgi:hypothetical protein